MNADVETGTGMQKDCLKTPDGCPKWGSVSSNPAVAGPIRRLENCGSSKVLGFKNWIK